MKIFLLEGTKMTKLNRIRPFSPLERGDMSYLASDTTITVLPSDEIGIKVVALLMVDGNRRGRRAAIALETASSTASRSSFSFTYTFSESTPGAPVRSRPCAVRFKKIFDKKRKIRRKEGRKYVVSQFIGGFLTSVA